MNSEIDYLVWVMVTKILFKSPKHKKNRFTKLKLIYFIFNSSLCACMNSLNPYYPLFNGIKCNMACSGNPYQICGGTSYFMVNTYNGRYISQSI